MVSKTLYIIGNGFDLQHNLKTSYDDFKNFLMLNDMPLYCAIENTFKDKLWSDFEKHLGDIDLEKFFSNNTELYPDIESDRDGEKDILPDNALQLSEKFTVDLKIHLRNWILESQSSCAEINKLPIDTRAKFLSFNYTDTLERIYKMDNNQITYIHNKALPSPKPYRYDEIINPEDETDIIIGHSRKSKLSINNKTLSRGVLSGYIADESCSHFNDYLSKSFKNSEDIISMNSCFFNNIHNIEKIIIIGHSLSNVDLPYFKEISKKAINVHNWVISYYGSHELTKNKRRSCKFINNPDKVEFVNIENIENLIKLC